MKDADYETANRHDIGPVLLNLSGDEAIELLGIVAHTEKAANGDVEDASRSIKEKIERQL